jgi:hypothetical protein
MAMMRQTATILIAISLSAGTLAQAPMVDTRSLGSAYARLVSFEAEPEIAAARFTVDRENPEEDETEIRTAKLPYYHKFGDSEEKLRWFVQATANYLEMDETLRIEITPDYTERLKANWEGFGALVEGGLTFSLSDHFTLASSIGLGLSRLESELDFSSQLIEDLLAPTADGVLYNWDTLASVVRASVSLSYDRNYGLWRVKGSGHLSGSYVDSFDESDRFDGFSDDAGNFGLKLDVSHPTGFEFRDFPVFLIGHLGYTEFVGGNRDELGFSGFGEAGASVGVQKFTLGLLGILGSDVSGWNLQFNYDY